MKSNNKSKHRGIRLNRAQDVRRLLSRLVNQTLQGGLETDVLRAVTYSCSMILKSLEIGELEDRLIALEERLK